MDMLAIWALICFVVALVLLALEVFIPSGGLLGFGAAVAAVAGIVFLFRINTTLGVVGCVVTIGSLPFLFMAALKVLPNTPLARWAALRTPTPLPQNQPDERSTLVGATGKSLTPLRPVGTCLIDGQRIECTSAAGVIPSQTPVRVVSVDGMQVRVRPKA